MDPYVFVGDFEVGAALSHHHDKVHSFRGRFQLLVLKLDQHNVRSATIQFVAIGKEALTYDHSHTRKIP